MAAVELTLLKRLAGNRIGALQRRAEKPEIEVLEPKVGGGSFHCLGGAELAGLVVGSVGESEVAFLERHCESEIVVSLTVDGNGAWLKATVKEVVVSSLA